MYYLKAKIFNPPEADKPTRGGQGLISPRLINSLLLAALQCLCRYPAALRRDSSLFWNSIFDNTNRLLFISIKLD
jgi:hypothetical protein